MPSMTSNDLAARMRRMAHPPVTVSTLPDPAAIWQRAVVARQCQRELDVLAPIRIARRTALSSSVLSVVWLLWRWSV